jgi:hypothetical protein
VEERLNVDQDVAGSIPAAGTNMTSKNIEDRRRDCRNWYRRHRATEYPKIKARAKRRKAALRALALDAKKGGCVDCPEKDPVVLDFDHRDRSKKIGDVGQMVAKGIGISRIRAEIAKCEIRCANCHRRRTARERHYNKAN